MDNQELSGAPGMPENGTNDSSQEDFDPISNDLSMHEMRAQLSQHSNLLGQLADVPTTLQTIMSKLSGKDESVHLGGSINVNDFMNLDYNADLWNDFTKDPNELETKVSSHDEDFSAVWQEEDDPAEGPSVSQSVADAVKQITSDEQGKEKLDKVKSRIMIPGNCAFLSVPKVNPELWGLLNPNVKSADVKAQATQQLLTKALSCFTQLTNLVVINKTSVPKETYQEAISLCKDGVMLLTAAQREANFKRMQLIKPNLNHQYSGICNTKPQGCAKFLFGDSLSEKLKESKSISGIMKQATTTSTFRFQPYQRQRTLNFRGQTRSPAGRPPSFRGRPFNQRFQRLHRPFRQ